MDSKSFFRVHDAYSFLLFQKCGSSSRMEGFGKHSGKDHLRKTMMKQEEVFRFQVRELHRLYRVQRTLMVEIKSSEKAQLHQLDVNSNSGTSNSTLNLSDWIGLAASETCDTSSEDQSLFLFGKQQMKEKIEAETDLQLTLSIARVERMRRDK